MIDETKELITSVRKNELEFPSEVSVTYSNVDNDYQVGTEYARRLTATHENKVVINLPMALTATEAAKIADIALNSAWYSGRYSYSFSTTYAHLKLSPGDLITIPLNTGRTELVKIISVEYGPTGLINYEAVPEVPSLYNSLVSGNNTVYVPQSLPSISPSVLLLIDSCGLTSDYTSSGWYVAASGYSTNWGGCTIFKSDDNGATWNSLQAIFSSESAIIGSILNTIGSADYRVWDKTNTINVRLLADTLSSSTELNLLNGANAALVGKHGRWELIQFKDAVLNGDGTYTLSNLLRGRFGTEWAIGTSVINDSFVLLKESDIKFLSTTDSELGINKQFKAADSNTPLETATTQELSYKGEKLKPYAPTNLNLILQPDATYTLKFNRRDRVNKSFKSTSSLPMSEGSEKYEIDVLNSSGVLQQTLTHSGNAGLSDPTIVTLSVGAYGSIYDNTLYEGAVTTEVRAAFTLNSNLFFLESSYSNGSFYRLRKVDPTTYASISALVLYHPDGTRLERIYSYTTDNSNIIYIAGWHTWTNLPSCVLRIDSTTMTVTHSFVSTVAADLGVVCYTNNNFLWVRGSYSRTIYKLTADTLTLNTSIVGIYGGNNEEPMLTDGTTIYFVNFLSGFLTKIDSSTNTVTPLVQVKPASSSSPQIGFIYNNEVYMYHNPSGGSTPSLSRYNSSGSRTDLGITDFRDFYESIHNSGKVACTGGYYDIKTNRLMTIASPNRTLTFRSTPYGGAPTKLQEKWIVGFGSEGKFVWNGAVSYSYLLGNTVWTTYLSGWSVMGNVDLSIGTSIKVYQISDKVGRGYPGTVSIQKSLLIDYIKMESLATMTGLINLGAQQLTSDMNCDSSFTCTLAEVPKTVLLLHFNDPNGSNIATNSVPGEPSGVVGSHVAISSGSAKFGIGGLACQGITVASPTILSSNINVVVPSSSLNSIPVGVDFCVELFFQPNILGNGINDSGTLLSISNGWNGLGWVSNSTSIDFTVVNGQIQVSCTVRPAYLNSYNPFYAWTNISSYLWQWYHIALTRQGYTYRAFLDGVKFMETTTTDAGISSFGSFFIGAGNGTRSFSGKIDEFRVRRGEIIYPTTSFAPPTSELT
jgi:hypothetical protein